MPYFCNTMNGVLVRRSIAAARSCIAVLLLAGAGIAHAGCLPAPTQELRALVDMASRDPMAVVAETDHDPTGSIDDGRLGWRQAARAEAFDILSRPDDARKVAMRLLVGGPRPRSTLYVELLARYALNGYRVDQIKRTRPIVTAVQHFQRVGSPAYACLLVTLGEMQRLNGDPERAVVDLTQAYRLTMRPAMRRQHLVAGEKLARVLDWAGDHQQSISLIDELIAWHSAKGETVALSTDLFFRANFYLHARDYRSALVDYERSRTLSSQDTDPVGFAFVDLKICETLIELRRLDRAEALCRNADRILQPHDEMAAGFARVLLARIAATRGQSMAALVILDRLLATNGTLAPFAVLPAAYRLRAELNGRLGRMRDAYHDSRIYMELVDQQTTSRQAKQSAVLRARFDTDRAAARNRELHQKLTFLDVQAHEQKKRYAVLAVSAALGAALLLVILGMSIIHRRKLIRIADTDPLTGLRNRRFVHAREKLFVAGATGKDAPLSLAIMDIDHFKTINDTYGHQVGDEVLVAFAALARHIFRSRDMIARWGGEEFIVILPQTRINEAVAALERFRTALEAGFATAGGPLQIRFSAGVTQFGFNEDLQTIIRKADTALYRAKSTGRNRIEIMTGKDAMPVQTHPLPEPMPLAPLPAIAE